MHSGMPVPGASVSMGGVRDGAAALADRASRMQADVDDEPHAEVHTMLQRSIFPWLAVVEGDTEDTTTAQEVGCHHGVPELVFDEYVAKEIHEAESCWSLPFTMLLVISYIGMMVSHHDAATIHTVESSLVDQIEERALFAYTTKFTGFKNIHDISSAEDFYSWLHLGLLPLVFEAIHDDWESTEMKLVNYNWQPTTSTLPPTNTTSTTTTTNVTVLKTTSTTTTTTPWPTKDPTYIPFFNRMIGGLRLSQERASDSGCQGTSELTAFYGKPCVGGKRYELDPDPMAGRRNADSKRKTWIWAEDNVTTMRQVVYEMEKDNWLDDKTQKVEVALPTYNGEYGVHTFIAINLYFNRGGRIWKRMIPESVFAEQYPSEVVWVYIFDFTWMVCLATIVVTEVREFLLIARRHGGHPRYWIKRYFDFWNCVDVLALVYGIFIIVMAAVGTNYVNDLNLLLGDIAGVDGAWDSDSVTKYRDLCIKYVDKVDYISYYSNRARILFACYPFVIIFRLLKAYSAQARLAMVTKTLYVAGQNLIHLMIVVSATYCAFVVSAMVLFGSYTAEFATVSRASVSCFRCMIGDFEWEGMSEVGGLEAITWVAIFIAINVLIFLNLLIVLLLDAYSEVRANMSSDDTLFQEIQQIYTRWIGARRGELVPLRDVSVAVKQNRHDMQKLFDANESEDPPEEKLQRFQTRDGHVLVVTVDFLRNNVLKMRTAQARELLIDAVNDFYVRHKSDAHIDQMVQTLHEMRDQCKSTKKELRPGDQEDSSDSDAPAKAENKKLRGWKAKSEEERRALFSNEVKNCGADLHHSRLWVGTQVLEDQAVEGGIRVAHLMSHRLASQDDMADDDEIVSATDAIDEHETRHVKLEAQIKQLEEKKSSANQILSKALHKIKELEPLLLEVTEETAEVATRYHELRGALQELVNEHQEFKEESISTKKQVAEAVQGRHACVDLVHRMSLENEVLAKELVQARKNFIESRSHRKRKDGMLEEVKKLHEPKLNATRQGCERAGEMRSEYYAKMLALAEKAATAPGAGGVPQVMQLLISLEDMNSADKLVRALSFSAPTSIDQLKGAEDPVGSEENFEVSV